MVTDPRQEVSELELDWGVAAVQQPQRPAASRLTLLSPRRAARGAGQRPAQSDRWRHQDGKIGPSSRSTEVPVTYRPATPGLPPQSDHREVILTAPQTRCGPWRCSPPAGRHIRHQQPLPGRAGGAGDSDRLQWPPHLQPGGPGGAGRQHGPRPPAGHLATGARHGHNGETDIFFTRCRIGVERTENYVFD